MLFAMLPGQRKRSAATGLVRAFVVLLAVAAARDGVAEPELSPILVDRLPRSLAGEWELAIGDPPAGVDGLDLLEWRPIRVPGTWQEQGIETHGTVWYRISFVIDPATVSVPMAFSCDQIRDADEVYLDGILAGRTGGFPPRYDKGTLMPRLYELPASITSRPGGRHLLAVRVHNPGPRGGGLVGEPILDSVSAAFWRQMAHELPRLMLVSALVALGFYALLFFARDRQQVDFLFFSLYTLSFAVYQLTLASIWTLSPLPLSLVFRVNVATACTLPPLILVFVQRLFERPLERRHRVALGLFGLLGVASLLLPRVDDLYRLLLVFYLLLVAVGADVLVRLVRDVRRHVPYSGYVLVGLSLMMAAALWDAAEDLGYAGDGTARTHLTGPTFLLFAMLFLWLAADRFARMRVAATTDPLTGLANRAVLFERLALEISRARRHGVPMTLAVLDLDHFKRFNDRYGHVVGDRLLIGVAQALVDSVRDTDLVARFGGEEFVVVLPEAGSVDAVMCLERLRKNVSDVRVKGAEEGTTISIGVATFDPNVRSTVSVTGFVRQADTALYQAKAQGRNRVVLAEGNPPSSASGQFTPPAFRRRRSDPSGYQARPGSQA